MTYRPNRIVLLVIALLLIGAAVVALLAAADVIGIRSPGELFGEATTSASAYPAAWLAAIAAVGVALAILGAWLVRRQLRLRRGGRLDTVTVEQTDRGRTTVKAASVASAAAADLRQVRGVVDSNVRLVTFGERPRLIVDLDFEPEASVRELLDRTEPAYDRLCRHLGVDSVHVDTVLRPSGKTAGSRVE